MSKENCFRKNECV